MVPAGRTGVLDDLAQLLPSYWLVQANHVSLGGPAWAAMGWIVVGAWPVLLTVLGDARLPARHRAGLGGGHGRPASPGA